MAAMTNFAVPAADGTTNWTLLYTAAGDVTVSINNRSPFATTMIRVNGSSGAVSDAKDAAAALLMPGDSVSLDLANGDKVLAMPLGPDAGRVTVTAVTSTTPKFAAISASSSGANAIVNAVTGKKILVLAAQLVANGSVNVKWQTASTDRTGLAYLVANAGYVLPHNPNGWFETVAGEALNLNLSAAIAVGGSIVYIEV